MKQYEIERDLQDEIIKKIDVILSNCEELEAPVILAKALGILEDRTGIRNAYAKAKQKYNEILMKLEPEIERRCREAENPLELGIRYALIGNYIDFGAMEEVDEEKLYELLGKADILELDTQEMDYIQKDLSTAKKLVYITDNAGEIVLDRVLVKIVHLLFPKLEIAVLVRAYPVLNDATLEDAVWVGLQDFAKVITNGTQIPGTVIEKLPQKAEQWVDSADLILAKGQGNFETLHGCNRNIYYLFLCKCDLFVDRFGVERFTPVIRNEKRI